MHEGHRGKENWRWNEWAHGLPRITGMQVIETAPARHPIGFAPPQETKQAVPEQPTPFPPQVRARQRI